MSGKTLAIPGHTANSIVLIGYKWSAAHNTGPAFPLPVSLIALPHSLNKVTEHLQHKEKGQNWMLAMSFWKFLSKQLQSSYHREKILSSMLALPWNRGPRKNVSKWQTRASGLNTLTQNSTTRVLGVLTDVIEDCCRFNTHRWKPTIAFTLTGLLGIKFVIW